MNISLPANNQIPSQVWVQTIGRGLYQLGSAVLLFYMPIVFVNYGNLSATEVGLAVGGGSVAGFLGNLLGGVLTDSPKFGRKRTLLASSTFAVITCAIAVFTSTFTLLLVTNIVFGFSTGLYWTAADSSVMDVTTPEQRQGAFSLLGVADNVGFAAGTFGGGVLLKLLHPEKLLFAAGGITFLILLLLFAVAMKETRSESQGETHNIQKGWKTALTDARLMIYLLVNTLFITYIALVGGNLPLYFVNFGGTSDATVANLFTIGYVGLGALLQVPVVKAISKLSYLTSLSISMAIWGVGFALVWVLGYFADMGEAYELGIFAVFAIASIIYKPTSSAWISELAPASLRGVYTAIAYQCWTIGYVVGPIVGGWAVDQSRTVAQNAWLAIALSTLSGLLILQILNKQNTATSKQEPIG
ncbi:MFS transporter [Dulcicalothrix desertica PCC 7102]|uniref:MFS transporter n=1 Tax=Dulcicalothrix desertica PCC 7102 TaxID=232991 RepID=A0A3S1CVG8_9CYAN|nr:MFS transporter [Dulcicalothrix desertica]RUT09604.1 MFS transporter [Dulcicalothrix desertica PCC 7102]TWH50803.1 putative MFS family arabinose efflux permease [Dulcicalothrix desertica PCC 7102]